MPIEKCPICKKARDRFEESAKWIPFCSKRCKDIDMGKWLTGHYQIQRDLEIEDLLEADPEAIPEDTRE